MEPIEQVLCFGTEIELNVSHRVAAVGEKLDLLVHLQALRLQELKEAPLGFLIISLHEGKAFARRCGVFVVPSERQDALARNDLEPSLLAALRFDVATINTDCQWSI